MKRGIITIIICALFFATVPAKATLVDSNSIIQDGIEYYIQTDKSVYNLAEQVEIVYRITNLTNEKWRVSGVSPIRDILVAAKDGEWGNTIWEWSWYHPAPPGPDGIALQPGESTEISGIWPQIDVGQDRWDPTDDTQVSPGAYTISGVLWRPGVIVSMDISIIPEPCSIGLFGCSMLVLVCSNRRKKR